ncbi:MAG TPA: hypothetical protein VG276_07160 [Actinomycetes bacterium]|jgi:hypothetical protein|nr:hypothetical protein [Actinomycetes bacterium]
MTASFPSPAAAHYGDGRAAWLPPFGRGNGLDAPAWAPIADVDPVLVDDLLAAFRDARVPAYAAPAEWPPRRAPGRRRHAATSDRLWVAALRYATAEEVLRTELSRLTADHGSTSGGPHAD